MSIAVSAAVYPSKILFGLISGMCATLVLVAGLIGFELVGETSLIVRIGLAVVCCCVAWYAHSRARLQRKIGCMIHVSGTGQIRLSAAKNLDKCHAVEQVRLCIGEEGELVQLLPTSTLWTKVMILHFRHADGRASYLPILPDALIDIDSKIESNAIYSALLVACRWALLHQHAEYAQQEKSFDV